MEALWFHRRSTKIKWIMTKSDDNINHTAAYRRRHTRSTQSFVIATIQRCRNHKMHIAINRRSGIAIFISNLYNNRKSK